MKFLLLLVAFLSVVSFCPAQEAGAFGITAQIGGVNSVGLVYHPVKNLAILPFVSASLSTSERGNTDTASGWYLEKNTSDQWSFGGGLNAQYYIASWDEVSTFIGAGGSYLTSETTYTDYNEMVFPDSTFAIVSTSSSVAARAYFGVQYNPVRWLAAYVSLGVTAGFYSTEDDQGPGNISESTNINLYTSGLGISLYF